MDVVWQMGRGFCSLGLILVEAVCVLVDQNPSYPES